MAASFALFDLGRVVLDWEPSRLYDKIFADRAERDRFLATICTMDWHTRHDAGTGFADNRQPLIARFPQYEQQIRAWGERWIEMFDGYIDGTPRLIEMLFGREVPVYALSNMPSETWPLMKDTFPLLMRFRDVVVSGETGLVKPDPRIFAYTLSKMGGPDPADVLFIDDNQTNIATADALGFRTHLFRDAASLERDLILEGLL